MSAIDPTITYTRCLHTDGHRWKLYEIHKTHIKKTKFFTPSPAKRLNDPSQDYVMVSRDARFFDDYDHMLSVIGLIRFAMGIKENIVFGNESYEVEELPMELDQVRTIQRSLLSTNRIKPPIERPLIMTSEDDTQRLTAGKQE